MKCGRHCSNPPSKDCTQLRCNRCCTDPNCRRHDSGNRKYQKFNNPIIDDLDRIYSDDESSDEEPSIDLCCACACHDAPSDSDNSSSDDESENYCEECDCKGEDKDDCILCTECKHLIHTDNGTYTCKYCKKGFCEDCRTIIDKYVDSDFEIYCSNECYLLSFPECNKCGKNTENNYSCDNCGLSHCENCSNQNIDYRCEDSNCQYCIKGNSRDNTYCDSCYNTHDQRRFLNSDNNDSNPNDDLDNGESIEHKPTDDNGSDNSDQNNDSDDNNPNDDLDNSESVEHKPIDNNGSDDSDQNDDSDDSTPNNNNSILKLRKEKLKNALIICGIKFRSDSKFCSKYIYDGDVKLKKVVQRMCEMKYLYDYCNMRDILNNLYSRERSYRYKEDYDTYVQYDHEEIFSRAEKQALKKNGGVYPTIMPWMDSNMVDGVTSDEE